MIKYEDQLIPLPNKDLWRGHRDLEQAPPATVSPEQLAAEAANPLNAAMAQIHLAAKGASTLTCVWCGLQGLDHWMREHVKNQHKSHLSPATDAQVAVHEMNVYKDAAVAKE